MKVRINQLSSASLFVLFILSIIIGDLSAQNLYNNPESAVYDSAHNRYLISNVGHGNIVQIHSDGSTSYFNTALTQTLGMVIIGNTLYVTDNLGIVSFNLETDQMLSVIQIPGKEVLNDITTDNAGYLYVTDSGNGNIYKVNINDRTSETIVRNIYWPNGILFDEFSGRLLFCAFGNNVPIREINLNDYSVSTVATTTFTDLDGLTTDNEHNIYVSSWGSNSVYKYNNAFSSPPEIFSTGHISPADIYYDKINNVLVVTNFDANEVEFIPQFPVSAENVSRLPNKYSLFQNYPNPFNPSTRIQYTVPQESHVRLLIFNSLGQMVNILVDEFQHPGIKTVEWNGTDLSNKFVSSGIYIYRLLTENFIHSKKMIFLK